MHHPTDRIAHTTAFVAPVVEHWLKREIAQWVHPIEDRSDDPSHYERTLLPWSYILLPTGYGHRVTISYKSYHILPYPTISYKSYKSYHMLPYPTNPTISYHIVQILPYPTNPTISYKSYHILHPTNPTISYKSYHILPYPTNPTFWFLLLASHRFPLHD